MPAKKPLKTEFPDDNSDFDVAKIQKLQKSIGPDYRGYFWRRSKKLPIDDILYIAQYILPKLLAQQAAGNGTNDPLDKLILELQKIQNENELLISISTIQNMKSNNNIVKEHIQQFNIRARQADMRGMLAYLNNNIGIANVAPGVHQPQPESHAQVNTHTATVHKSVSDSATNLKRDYRADKFESEMANMQVRVFGDPVQMKELQNLIASNLEEGQQPPPETAIISAITSALKHAQDNPNSYKDSKSDMTLDEIFKILLVAIDDISDPEIKKSAMVQLCSALYSLQTEYGAEGASCDPGFVNALIYSQQTTLPDYVKIVIQTLSFAAKSLQEQLQYFGRGILSDSSITSAAQFEEAVKKQADEAQCAAIVKNIVVEYFMVFGYSDKSQAISSIEAGGLAKLNEHCVKLLTGGEVKDIFGLLDFEKLYNDTRARSTVAKANAV